MLSSRVLEDHKDNFNQKHPCRLINPCKSEIGAISKSILDRVNSNLRKKLHVNQWKNTDQVIEWFSSIKNKQNCTFVQLDIKEFYPSISRQILEDSIEFAKLHTTITEKEIRTIFHCRKSLLFFNDEAWKKKNTHDCFDVTMGSFDGAEICELVGIFIIHKLSSIINKNNMGLYRDDGLMILRNMTKRTADIKRKEIIQIFKNVGFDIDISINMTSADFLDITMDLISNTYKPYKKPNDHLQYIHTSSNHPTNILKQLPVSIKDRLVKNSSNATVFNQAKPEYEEALRNSGHNPESLKCETSPKRTGRHHMTSYGSIQLIVRMYQLMWQNRS